MTRIVLASSAAAIALGFSFGAMAQVANPGTPNWGDDVATIQQANETGSFASQNQPGQSYNTAYIFQQGGTNESATQDQNANNSRAYSSRQQIYQGLNQANDSANAAQTDNSNGSFQYIQQDGNARSGDLNTRTTQTITAYQGGTLSGLGNYQWAEQTGNYGSSIAQTIGQATDIGNQAHANSQTATQSGQTNSSIIQFIDGSNGPSEGGSGNTQTATQTSNGAGNVIAQQTFGSPIGNTQTATQTGYGSFNQISQYEYGGNIGSIQTATQDGNTNGLILQYQSATYSNQQTATQSYGIGNQIGQYQAGYGNFASASQTGGSNNLAIQNQGGINFVNNGGSIGFAVH